MFRKLPWSPGQYRRATASTQFAPKWLRRQVTATHLFRYDTSFTGGMPFLTFCLEVSTCLTRNVKWPWAPTFGQLHYPPASTTAFSNLMLTKTEFKTLNICRHLHWNSENLVWQSHFEPCPLPQPWNREADLANELCSGRSLTPAPEAAFSCWGSLLSVPKHPCVSRSQRF